MQPIKYLWAIRAIFYKLSFSHVGKLSYIGKPLYITGAKKTKASNSQVLVPTGQTTPVCNIYDMGGNVWEWTTETSSFPGYPYAVRGGDYLCGFAGEPAGYRKVISDGAYDGYGFRLTLFM